MIDPIDPLSPDAPLHHLLSLQHNPMLADMTPEQLRARVQQLRQFATSPAALTSKLSAESEKIKPKREKSKKQQLLDSI